MFSTEVHAGKSFPVFENRTPGSIFSFLLLLLPGLLPFLLLAFLHSVESTLLVRVVNRQGLGCQVFLALDHLDLFPFSFLRTKRNFVQSSVVFGCYFELILSRFIMYQCCLNQFRYPGRR